MSIAVLAQDLAARGRHGDSVLVHMSKDEVAGLQALARQHGTSLTINPQTGLPEAFKLSGIFKAVLPALAGFALGPAGFGIMSSMGAALTVGGIGALATGSLEKGLAMGLGAYGGSELGGALTGSGATQAIEGAGKAAMVDPATSAGGATAAKATYGELPAAASHGNFARFDRTMQMPEVKPTVTFPGEGVPSGVGAWDNPYAKTLGATPTSMASAGLKGAIDDPMAFVKKNHMNMLMAAAPMMLAGDDDKSKVSAQSQGFIRPHKFDPRTGQWTAQEPVAADQWGARQFADGGIAQLTGDSKAAFDYLNGGPSTRGLSGSKAILNDAAGSATGIEMKSGETKWVYDPRTGEFKQITAPTDAAGKTVTPGGGVSDLLGAGSDGADGANGATSPGPTGIAAIDGAVSGLSAAVNDGHAAIGQAIGPAASAIGSAVSSGLTGIAGIGNSIGASVASSNSVGMTGIDGDAATAAAAAAADGDSAAAAAAADGAAAAGDAAASGNDGSSGVWKRGGMVGIQRLAAGGAAEGLPPRFLRGPGDGVSDSIPAMIDGQAPAAMADGEFVVPARIVSELGNGSSEAGARQLYAMIDRIQAGRRKTTGKGKVAVNSRSANHLPA